MMQISKCGILLFLLLTDSFSMTPNAKWIATWASSAQAADVEPNDPLLKIDGQTVRERVRISAGGKELRIRLSNEFGKTPLLIGAVTVAAPITAAQIDVASLRAVTFGGEASVSIPPGAPMLSDPIQLPVEPTKELSVSIYFPEHVETPTVHALALKHATVSAKGDFTKSKSIDNGSQTEASIALSAVLVPSVANGKVIVAFGDSITDGDQSSLDADRNWTGDFARRVSRNSDGAQIAIVNSGIAGNRLLSDGLGVGGLARFDRDALGIPGVTHIVILEGLNDIAWPGAKIGGRYLADPAHPCTASSLIAAYRQLIARAHARGIKVIGATLTPFEGAQIPGYYSDSKESLRQTINQWVRTSGAFDAVVDFDAALRDPDHPSRQRREFSSNDHIHPNDAGYQAMSDSIIVSIFK